MEEKQVTRLEPHFKYVDTGQYLTAICQILKDGKTAVIPVSGGSMMPFLVSDRDFVMLSDIGDGIRKGDIVLYQRRNGQFILHRVCKVKKKKLYYMIGDAQNVIEGPIMEEQIRAKVVKIMRNGIWISKTCFWWWFFEVIWIRLIPVRKYIWRGYQLWKTIWRRLERKNENEGRI